MIAKTRIDQLSIAARKYFTTEVSRIKYRALYVHFYTRDNGRAQISLRSVE